METVFDKFLKSNEASACFTNAECPEAIYHAEHRFISKHMLDVFNDCPAKYSWEFIEGNHKEEDSPALRLGSALHCLVLRPEDFYSEWAVASEDIRTRSSKKFEEFKEWNSGKEILLADEWQKIDGMRDSLHRNKEANVLLFESNGENELTVAWRSSGFGGRLSKARVDRVLKKSRIIIDLKTCASASPKAFANAIEKFRYDVQAAWYCEGLTSLEKFEGLDVPDWSYTIVAIEKEPPYAVAVYHLTDWMDLGFDTAAQDLQNLLECENSGVFPGYKVPNGEIKITPWARKNRNLED